MCVKVCKRKGVGLCSGYTTDQSDIAYIISQIVMLKLFCRS